MIVKNSPKVRLQHSNPHQLYPVLQRLELDTMTTLDQQTKTNGTLSRRVSNVRILKPNAICNLENSNVARGRGQILCRAAFIPSFHCNHLDS